MCLRCAGVVLALGHSDAGYATASAALKARWTHVSHAFDGQRGFRHRELGVLGAVLTSREATAEVFADGVHIDPAAIQSPDVRGQIVDRALPEPE